MANPFSDYGISDDAYDLWKKQGASDEEIGNLLTREGVTSGETINVTGPDGTNQTQLLNAAGGSTVVPYGTDAATFAAMTPEQQMQAQLLGSALQTKAKNESAVMFGAGDTAAKQQAAIDAAAKAAEERIRDYKQLEAGANMRDAAAAQGVKQSGATANAADQALMTAMGGYLGGATVADLNALTEFRNATSTADAEQQKNANYFGKHSGELNDRDRMIADLLADQARSYDPVTARSVGDASSAAGDASADPRSVEAQMAYLDQFMEGSNPSMSATERLMLEQARRTSEQEQKASRDATLRNLQARGMLGSGEEIAAMLGAGASASQNRQLADLAALASAQQRAERQQSMGTDLAGQVRGSSFVEDYQTGSATDSMTRFNTQNSIQQAQFDAELKRQQQEAEWRRIAEASGVQLDTNETAHGRAKDTVDVLNDATKSTQDRAGETLTATTGVTGTAFDRAEELAKTGLGVNESGHQRNLTTAEATAQLGENALERGKVGIGMQETAANNAYGGVQDQIDNTKDFVGLFTGQGTSDTGAVMDAQKSGIADNATTKAIEDLKDDEDGILGMGGVLGIF
jgi:hypothetical protein